MYYGTIQGDKIVQGGMLPYDKVPLSMALTPHHFIFLYDTQVVFYNRVSKRIIQKERVDWSSSEDNSQLLMDIRRPDQVWLRRRARWSISHLQWRTVMFGSLHWKSASKKIHHRHTQQTTA
jgi:hypothetical protein